MPDASVLLDTSGLFASLDPNDPHYFRARAFLRRQRGPLVVADTVFSEAMTLIKGRLGSQAAVTVGTRLLSTSTFSFYRLTDEDAELTWRIFTRYTDKEWSYVDCSLLALSRRLDVEQVFAFTTSPKWRNSVWRVFLSSYHFLRGSHVPSSPLYP